MYTIQELAVLDGEDITNVIQDQPGEEYDFYSHLFDLNYLIRAIATVLKRLDNKCALFAS